MVWSIANAILVKESINASFCLSAIHIHFFFLSVFFNNTVRQTCIESISNINNEMTPYPIISMPFFMNHKYFFFIKQNTLNDDGPTWKMLMPACIHLCTIHSLARSLALSVSHKLMSLYAYETLIKYYIISRFIYSLCHSLARSFAPSSCLLSSIF